MKGQGIVIAYNNSENDLPENNINMYRLAKKLEKDGSVKYSSMKLIYGGANHDVSLYLTYGTGSGLATVFPYGSTKSVSGLKYYGG